VEVDAEQAEHVFLLSGTDNKIHVYREVRFILSFDKIINK
jgi:hypothetical protein